MPNPDSSLVPQAEALAKRIRENLIARPPCEDYDLVFDLLTEFQRVQAETREEAFKAGMLEACDHPLKDEWIAEAFAQWHAQRQRER